MQIQAVHALPTLESGPKTPSSTCAMTDMHLLWIDFSDRFSDFRALDLSYIPKMVQLFPCVHPAEANCRRYRVKPLETHCIRSEEDFWESFCEVLNKELSKLGRCNELKALLEKV